MKAANRLLYILALVKFLLPFFVQHNYYQLHRDEFLYLAEGNHLAWGYMEVPPLLGLLAWISNALGGGWCWVKCWPSLFGALTFLLSGKIILSLGGSRFAVWLTFLCFTLTGFLRVHFLFQPNAPEIFFWTLMAFAMIRYVQTDRDEWLYLAALGTGLGMLSKYSVAFYVLGLLGGLLLTRQRRVFMNKHFYYAMLLALLLFLPNFLWQYRHQFPVIFHMKKLQQTQLQYVSPLAFLKGQLLQLFPALLIWLSGIVFLLFNRKGQPFLFIALAYGGVLVLLLLGHGKPYYALGAYPPLLAFGALQLEQWTQRRKAWRYPLLAVPIVLGLFTLPVLLPVATPEKLSRYYRQTHLYKAGMLRWEDLREHELPQDFADMTGWEELAQKVSNAYARLNPTEQQHTFLFCDNYGQAGALNYYRSKYHYPAAYSFNASFLYWMPDSVHIDHLLLVSEDPEEMHRSFLHQFASATLTDSITNPYAVERGSLILLLKSADTSFNRFFTRKLATEKKLEYPQLFPAGK